MKLKLNPEMVGWLNWVIRVPDAMPLRLLGPLGSQFSHYSPKDRAGAKQMVALKHWMEEKVLEKVERGYQVPKEDVEVALPQSFIDRIKEVNAHYEPMGLVAPCVEPYLQLEAALDGKDLIIEDLCAYSEE